MRTTTAWVSLIWWMALGCAAPDLPQASDSPALLEVSTELGALRGIPSPYDGAIGVFRGVPYAAPPVGDLRFRPPRAPDGWSGVRSADTFGTACWQERTSEDTVYSRGMDLERSEDCLFLNVWTGAESIEERRPVMVWFHGGSHTTGHGSSTIFDGTELAKKGAVVVTANYRLGPFGFLAHPALSSDSEQGVSGNYGLLDKVEVLRWVRDHSAAFGGDPRRVTIFGQSAGSMSVCALMATPLSQGLFHRVIGQSGTCLGEHLPLEAEGDGESSGHEIGRAVAAELEVQSAEELRAVPAEAIQGASAIVPGGVRQFLIDGWFFERQIAEVFRRGEQHAVPVLTGTTADEGTALFAMMPVIEREELDRALESDFGQSLDRALELYARELEHSPRRVMQAIAADRLFAIGARRWVAHTAEIGQPAYLYSFERDVPTFRLYLNDRPDMGVEEERGLGAYHSGDLAYTFGTVTQVGLNWQEWDVHLAQVLSSYWVNFAAGGDPNGEGLPAWPRYEPETDLALALRNDVIEPVAHWKKDIVDLLTAAKTEPLP